MFTIDDIRNIALQMEENGERTYREAAREADNAEIAELLNWMADEESRHAKWFSQLTSAKPLSQEQQEMAVMGKNLLQDMVKNKTFSLSKTALSDLDNIQGLLIQAADFEKDTAMFYEFIAGLVDDGQTSAQLQIIIEEEKRHAEKLEELLQSLTNTAA
ncbi:MAG: hypothetical protein CSB24_00430 [Deltaproteobacteria bacterium]|nr:MAG: hypothetical protein CSB24_00430 [Deltaproteobacteria bacterium]